MPATIRIIIVNPNEIEGEGLRRLLSDSAFADVTAHRDLRTVATMTDAQQAKSLLLLRSPNDRTAIEQCRAARATWPAVHIAIMAETCDSATVAEAFRAGTDGYLSRDASLACLVEMLKLIGLGEKLIPSEVVSELAAGKFETAWADAEIDLSDAKVSERELQILHGLIQGEPNKVISRRLNITEATVKVHVKSILRKLHVINRTQAAVWALSRGLTGAQPPSIDAPGIPPAATDYLEQRRGADQ